MCTSIHNDDVYTRYKYKFWTKTPDGHNNIQLGQSRLSATNMSNKLQEVSFKKYSLDLRVEVSVLKKYLLGDSVENF